MPTSFKSSLSPNNSFGDNCNVSGFTICAFYTNPIQSKDNMSIDFFTYIINLIVYFSSLCKKPIQHSTS
jgi:hypothetical protein